MLLDRTNNFDLLRLIAAIQVLLLHTNGHLNIGLDDIFPVAFIFLKVFPGVPVFFTISGFLITASLSRNETNFKKYFINRFLRIYPALWLCFLVSFVSIIALGKFSIDATFLFQKTVWIFGQISIFQFFTPEFLRPYGVGTPNGALWTIPVEIQFYLILPLIWIISKKIKNQISVFVALSIISILFYTLIETFISEESLTRKLSDVFILTYLFNFCIGAIIFILFKKIAPILKEKAGWWLLGYFIYYFIFSFYLGLYKPTYTPNILGVVGIIILSLTVISLAYTKKYISNKILRGNDISYGVYIYHMVIINIFIEVGWTNTGISFIGVFILSCLLAWLSWRYCEKKVLLLKHKF